tara:strand:+ start:1370 stop:1864 length:495 start_codon:yes stop_codon:yes gene_type:complete
MTKEKYENLRAHLNECAKGVMSLKQPEYTGENEDVLHNFKSTADLVGISPLEAWAVFFIKHVQSVVSHAKNPSLKESEPIKERYVDLINYVHLGYALVKEQEDIKIEFLGKAKGHDPQFGDYTVQPGDAGTEGAYLRKHYPNVYNKYKKYYDDKTGNNKSSSGG